MAADPRPAISPASLLELHCVLAFRDNPRARRRLDALLEDLDLEVVPFTAEHARIAREAYRDYGKGSGHPAALNLSDCFAYALATARREPLQFAGEDFTHTDLLPAAPSPT